MNGYDKRIATLVKRRYTTRPVGWRDVMVENVGKEMVQDYLISRTLYHPRDIIVFLNLCVKCSKGSDQITATTIRDAEGDYSQDRLNSIKDEWRADYPDLDAFMPLIMGRRTTFRAATIAEELIAKRCLEVAVDDRVPPGPLSSLAQKVVDEVMKPDAFRRELLSVFHRLVS